MQVIRRLVATRRQFRPQRLAYEWPLLAEWALFDESLSQDLSLSQYSLISRHAAPAGCYQLELWHNELLYTALFQCHCHLLQPHVAGDHLAINSSWPEEKVIQDIHTASTGL